MCIKWTVKMVTRPATEHCIGINEGSLKEIAKGGTLCKKPCTGLCMFILLRFQEGGWWDVSLLFFGGTDPTARCLGARREEPWVTSSSLWAFSSSRCLTSFRILPDCRNSALLSHHRIISRVSQTGRIRPKKSSLQNVQKLAKRVNCTLSSV